MADDINQGLDIAVKAASLRDVQVSMGARFDVHEAKA
jgi:hypothetical protein